MNGATFAYFSVVNGETSSTTNVQAKTPSVGTIALEKTTQNLYLGVTPEDMAQSVSAGAPKNYYATTNAFGVDGAISTDNRTESDTPITLATLKLTGGEDGTSYTCSAMVDVTIGGNMASSLTDADAFMTLKTTNGTTIGADDYKFDTDTPVALKTISDGSEHYKNLQVGFSLKKGENENAKLEGTVYLVNTKSNQNALAGKSLTVSVELKNLSCDITPSE